jgi:DNA-binding response OmpR family regulator
MPILYVDDDESRTLVRSAWLRTAGFKVVTALNGRDALTLDQTSHPRAVLVDVHLPDIGGVELCERMKAEHPKRPVILFSAIFRSPHEQLEGLSAGADLYLADPIDRETFLRSVTQVLHQS